MNGDTGRMPHLTKDAGATPGPDAASHLEASAHPQRASRLGAVTANESATVPVTRAGADPQPMRPTTTVVVPRIAQAQAHAQSATARRATSTVRATDAYAVVGAGVASLSTTALLFTQLTGFSGGLGFVVVGYVLFLAFYALLVSFDEDGPAVRDRIVSVGVHSMAALMLTALVFVVVYTLWEGRTALPHLNFFTQDMAKAGPLDPLTVGGIRHAVLGTLVQIGLALLITVPTGLVCAVFLNEVPGRYGRFVRTIVEAMTALPSIVAGLFVFATVILAIGVDKSGLAASLAISVMMLPIVIRAADVVIRLVPGTLREASYALGAPRWRAVWHVVLPTARSGLTTAVILGTARGVGETSPVLLTAGFTAVTNLDPGSGPMVSLPLATFEFVKSPEHTMIVRGFGTAATLMALVLLLFIVARVVGGRGPGHVTRRGRRRRALASAEDLRRIESRPRPAAAGRPTEESTRSTP
ncbi:phosphate ABC transporter permease PstA [Wenjunlia tyrosinilytica]|uniref:Phosphate transport system permease protein PstA n=1 Tax=Wenjunlia tyrosinilytica TaxID=1544741 RepID=A0A918DUW4_9ACTN|nr:phosphate ABC transporter permease PstA [Wenjunlia tyrosinilytica]GGO83190.1 phosphate transport system permease protein PstA [Wenjunlia tyrosinilytica]